MQNIKKFFYLDFKFRLYKASIFSNGLIYFLGRLPIIGKSVPTTMLYREYGLKKVIAIVQLIFSVLFVVLWNSIPFVISYFLAYLLQYIIKETIPPFVVWFILFNLIGNCFYLVADGLNKEITFIRCFNVSKEKYIKKKFVLDIFSDLIYLLPGLIVFGILENQLLLYLLLGLSSNLLLSLFWGAVNLRITLLKRRIVVKVLTIVSFSLIVLGIFYALIVNGNLYLFEAIFINRVDGLICLVLCLPAFYYYRHFNRFDAYARQLIVSSEVVNSFSKNKNTAQDKYLGEGKKMKLVKAKNEKKIENKNGMDYINALLFSRFKTSLYKQLATRLIIISLVMAVIVFLYFISPVSIESQELETNLYNLIPSMFFILYVISLGKKVTQTLFVNCDSSMLEYPFYRESKPIVRGFFYRFFKIFYYNGLIGATIFIWLLFFNVVIHFVLSFDFMVLFFFVVICLTILFSFHNLFVYYILQPFTTDLEVKNPLYKIIDTLFYLLAYLSLQLKSGGFIYAIVISIFAIAYFSIGSFVIVKYAPKTFKLKN